MKKWFKKLFCKHDKEILIKQEKDKGYYINTYQCEKCGHISKVIIDY